MVSNGSWKGSKECDCVKTTSILENTTEITRLIVIRHGFSEANMAHKFAGHSDFPLTDIGVLQAKQCAEALKLEKIDAIYASDLKRAFGTAVPVADAHGLPITAHKGLREIFAGDWEGNTFNCLEEKYSQSYEVWKKDIGNAHPDGGESVAELYDRVIAALQEIAEENQGRTVCIATHATPIRALCTAAAGLGAQSMRQIPWTANASISLFEYENGKFRAIYTSRDEHLGDLKTKFPSNV